MVQNTIQKGFYPASEVRGTTSLLHKGGSRRSFGNYRPITLLNVTYKIYANLLQKILQPILMELISADQTCSLPLRYIVDNILLVQETLTWAKTSHQPLLLLKLDFAKAYDRVSWQFLFQAMNRLGFDQTFVHMTCLLFTEASAIVSVNGEATNTFSIKRGVL